MDGKGRAIDNVFTERFWRSYKYEHLYGVANTKKYNPYIDRSIEALLNQFCVEVHLAR